MRKGHIKLLEKARNYGFSDKEFGIIESSDLALVDLNVFVEMIRYINQHFDDSEGILEACMLLAGYKLSKPCVFSNNIKVIYYDLLEMQPLVDELKWLYKITINCSAEDSSYNTFKPSLKWMTSLYMRRNGFDDTKIEYMLYLKAGVSSFYNRSEYHSKMLKILQSCIGDEFKYNDDSFLTWFLNTEANLDGPYYARNKFDIFYDKIKHKFTTDIRQFYELTTIQDKYYIYRTILKLQKQKLYDLQMKRGFYAHLYQYVADKFDEMSSDKANKHHDIVYHKLFYYEPEIAQNLQKAYEILKTKLTVSKAFDEVKVIFSDAGYIYITMIFGESVVISGDRELKIVVHPIASQIYELMITPDELLFLRQKTKDTSNKFTAMKMTDFLTFLEFHTEGIHDLFFHILSYFSRMTKLPQDVLYDLKLVPKVRFPFAFNDFLKYYNKSQFIVLNFKTAAQIPVNFNKRNIVLSWLIIHSWNMVANDKSRQILMQLTDDMILYGDDGHSVLTGSLKRGLCEAFLAKVITNRIDKILQAELVRRSKRCDKLIAQKSESLSVIATGILDDERVEFLQCKDQIGDVNQIALDYVSMCRQVNKRHVRGKVDLDIKSYAQLKNRHDMFNRNDHAFYETRTGNVTIPKESKFLTLREYLPDDFEWIKDRKRLILETELQHHCVWSYARKISRDECAIYSYEDTVSKYGDKPKRYTIEFRCNGKNYYVVQVQGRYDQVNARNMRAYIQSILDLHQLVG